MIAAKDAILMHDAMRDRRAGFAVADIVKAGFRDFEIRAQLRFWCKRGAVEILPVRSSRDRRHVVLYKVTSALPPVIAAPGEGLAELAEMLAHRFARRLSRPVAVQAQRQMWTALRALRVAEPGHLGLAASIEDCTVSPGQARSYLTNLAAGGYVASHGGGTFRLLPAKAGPFAVLFARGLRLDLNTLEAVNVNSQPSANRVSRGGGGMKRGPTPGARSGVTSAVEKARAAWGEAIRPEVLALAEACDRATQSAVARQLGYSGGLISYVLSNRYPGDVETVLAKVRGAFMGEVVICPVIGEIGLDRCLLEQKRPFANTNSIRVRLFHACRTCPENRQKKGGSDA